MPNLEGFARQNARTRRFTCGAPRDVRVSNDGERVLFLRSSASDDPVHFLWSLQVRTGEERVVADPRSLLEGADDSNSVPAEELARRERARELGLGIVAYDATKDLSRACFAIDGRVYLVEFPDPEATVVRLVELPSTGDAFDPRLSPDGSTVAYVSGSSLRVTGAGGDRRVIGGTSPTVSWGSAEFIAAEEMGRSRGHWWSPDGSRLLATRVDLEPVEEWWIPFSINPGDRPRTMRYPAAGKANAEVSLAIFDPWSVDPGAVTVFVDWRGGEQFEYLAKVSWAVDGRADVAGVVGSGNGPLLMAQTRNQRIAAIFEVDPRTGATAEIHRITDSDWVDLVPGTPCYWGKALVTVEPRDGTNRLCRNGQPVSPPDLQVRSVVDVDGDSIVVRATTNPIDIDVVRVFPDGTTEVLAGGGGVHSVALGGGTFVFNSATLDDLSATTVVSSEERPGGTPVEYPLSSLAEDPLVQAKPTFQVVGDRTLQVAVLFPSAGRPAEEALLPVLFDPYGGPHAQRVLRAAGHFLTSQWFADRGFAVVVVDGRGTPGRGPAWERSVGGDLAGPALEDQVDALHALAKADSRLDLGRVGIRGWSFGGYLAALAVLRRPDVFHAAVAGAPVADWRLYDTHYTERYLGHPDLEPENYLRSSLCEPAGWSGTTSQCEASEGSIPDRPLLLIHGLADDNVVVGHTLSLSQALLEAGRPHQVLPLPGITHMTPQEEVAESILRLQLRFLAEALKMEPHPE